MNNLGKLYQSLAIFYSILEYTLDLRLIPIMAMRILTEASKSLLSGESKSFDLRRAASRLETR